ncbi:unnamed protein product [Pedinophyceae sp. YPF-701]|nr:unnamed protein product [Pedinophyceae sp. YPF-701]
MAFAMSRHLPGCQLSQPARAGQRPCGRAVTPARSVRARGLNRSANRSRWSSGNAGGPGGDAADGVAGGQLAELRGDEGQLLEACSSLTPSQVVWGAAEDLAAEFAAVDRHVFQCSARVQRAMARARVGPHHFQGSTGYGHGDIGRDALDEIVAEVMGAESAMVRAQFMSGTHAIATALYACLRPGDELLAAVGAPYDTMEEVIGLRGVPNVGSLRDWGVSYREHPTLDGGRVDVEGLGAAVARGGGKTRVVLVQRSCGYALRPTLTIEEVGACVRAVKEADPDCLVLVDNCYGEFVEAKEPPAVGADLCMGSLIKNGGGTIVPGGGYVAGRADLIDRVAARLSAPGLSTDAGQVDGTTLRLMFQGLWLAPQMTAEALKGGMLVAAVMRAEGHAVDPKMARWPRVDFITPVELGSPEAMVAFARALQERSPVGSYIRPEPGVTAGYGDPVVFADGTFIDGATSEMSADGPMRAPYVIYCQGGNHWTHWAYALEGVVEALRGLAGSEQAERADSVAA